ncbi:hypothetical protein H0E84_01175 [Luteimonas sp. SJ-92]|uniref:Uncharacterized protein n=1 Tax=Luteimonas salinisoli TaxID=2752307 RepID=A0A853J7Y1_9GAMM|nr:hypothetical protein [Luteimonas salinisoli]NZA24985.1 hypothetical protein [Luteimonas salinisoli]
MQTVARKHLKQEFLPAMAAYALVLIASVSALRHVDAIALRSALALLPLVPIGFAARAMLRYVRACDELQRRIELEGMGMGALLLCLCTFALGLLGSAGVLRLDGTVALIWIMPAYVLLYAVCKCVAARRYR